MRGDPTSLPFDAAADTGFLVPVDRLTCEHGLKSCTKIGTGYGFGIAWSAVV